MKTYVLSAAVALGLSLTSLAASASVGAVKVDTFGNMSLQLGTICNTYSAGSHPIGIACEIVAQPGSGTTVGCGTGTCTPYGSILSTDTIGAYCQDTTDNDAIVFCTTSTTPGPLAPPSAGDEQKGK